MTTNTQDKSTELQQAEVKAQADLYAFQAARGDKEYSVNVTSMTPDEEAIYAKAAGRAQAINLRQQLEDEQEAQELQNSQLFKDLDGLSPMQRMLKIEEVAWPELQRLKAEFLAASEALKEIAEEDLTQYQINYCHSGRHSKTKLVYVETPHMRNVYLQSGKLTPEGFRPISDITSGSGVAKVLFLANDVKNITELYDSEEAKENAKAERQQPLKRAQEKHKEAVKAFTDYKKLVSDTIKAVPTLEKLLTKF